VITHVEGTPVQDAITLRMLYWAAGMDGKAGLQVNRNGEPLALEITRHLNHRGTP
jgi:hypothetical protein